MDDEKIIKPQGDPVTPIPSASILIVRPAPAGTEIFMVLRNPKADFAAGALVFPGGKIDGHDATPQLRDYCLGAEGLSDEQFVGKVAAIRETFEESGILYGKRQTSDQLLSPEEVELISHYREQLNKGEVTLLEFLQREKLFLTLDRLHAWGNFITPEMAPKRYDTYFYLAVVPDGQNAMHDGDEHVSSLWMSTQDILTAVETRQYIIVLATHMNVLKLHNAGDLNAAIELAALQKIYTVTPQVIERAGEIILRIPSEAGYGVLERPWV